MDYALEMRDWVAYLPEHRATRHYETLLATNNKNVKKTQAKNGLIRNADVIWFLNPE